MADDREDRIRTHAYALWEKEGRPEGRHSDHWHEASTTIGGDPAEDVEQDRVDDSAATPPAPLPPEADPAAELAPLSPPGANAGDDTAAIAAETAPAPVIAPPAARPAAARKARGRKGAL